MINQFEVGDIINKAPNIMYVTRKHISNAYYAEDREWLYDGKLKIDDYFYDTKAWFGSAPGLDLYTDVFREDECLSPEI